jgi:hypothetical protein
LLADQLDELDAEDESEIDWVTDALADCDADDDTDDDTLLEPLADAERDTDVDKDDDAEIDADVDGELDADALTKSHGSVKISRGDSHLRSFGVAYTRSSSISHVTPS